MDEQVSELTTGRLSVYLRCLEALEEAGVRTVSSRGLAERFNLNAALIRKDLAHFGEFGVRGVGYFVEDLRRQLRAILGLDRGLRVAILGAGNLGCALADYQGFRKDGFEIVAMFDVSPERVGQRSRSGLEIRHLAELDEVVRRSRVDIGVIAVPQAAAQEVAARAAAAGIRALLNFAPGALRVPAGVRVKDVDFGVSLGTLSFFLTHGEA